MIETKGETMKLNVNNFNPRAGGGYVEYCVDGYLSGKRLAVGRFKYKGNTMANKKRLMWFLITKGFTVAEISGPNYWDLMKERGWTEFHLKNQRVPRGGMTMFKTAIWNYSGK
jgi:hypothetical protein